MINKHKLEFILFLFIGKFLSIFGIKSIKSTSKVLAFFFFNIIRIRRNVVIDNLTHAFPHLNTNEIQTLAYKNYVSIAITFLEIFNFPKANKSFIKTHLSDVGFDLIREKYKENKGLILLTAHFGNWELGALASGLHLNESVHVLVKIQHNPYVAKWLNDMREKFGNVQIFLGLSVRELYTTIKKGKIVGIVGDQRGPRESATVDFFGKKTATFQGTAAIALKTKCPVIVLLCARNKEGRYKGIIEEIKTDDISGSKEEQVKEFNQRYMKILENTIRKYPEQWFWMHNIWKY